MGGGGLLAAFLALMVSGLPVAIAMAVASLAYVMISGNIPDFVVIHRMYGGVDSFPLLAVPFFIWAGNLMNSAGITNRIYNFALALVGWLKGGLGHVNVVGSMLFAGMSGTAIADAAGLGTIEIKAMKDHGYSTEFAVGVTAASATVGPIIPPSLPFVIYGMMASVSIGALFLAGVIPGIVMAITMMLTVAYFAHTRNYGRDVPFSLPKLAKATLEVVMVACVPLGAWLLLVVGVPGGWAVLIAFGILLVLDKLFNFSAVMALLTPVLLIGGMTIGRIHAHRGSHRRLDVGAVPRPGLVPLARLAPPGQDHHGHDRDHRHGALHRRFRVDLRLAAHGHARHRRGGELGDRLHHQPERVPAPRQPAAAVRRLLPRADRGDHAAGADPVADRAQARHRPGPLRARSWC